MRISATILSAAVLAAFAGFPAESLAGGRGPVVIPGLGPNDFAPRAVAHLHPIRHTHAPHHRRMSDAAYEEASYARPRPRFAFDEPLYAHRWRHSAPLLYPQAELAPAHRAYPDYLPYEGNPYERGYRPGAYTAADPLPPASSRTYVYFIDEGPLPYAR